MGTPQAKKKSVGTFFFSFSRKIIKGQEKNVFRTYYSYLFDSLWDRHRTDQLRKETKQRRYEALYSWAVDVWPWQEYPVGVEVKDETGVPVFVRKSATELSWGK